MTTDEIAALTPPETAEAVPVAMRNGVSAASNIAFWFFKDLTGGQRKNLFRVFGLPLEEIRSEHDERRCLNSILSDPEAARLREDLERVKQENAALREERHLADNALVDRYRDPKTGSFQFPTDVAAIVRRLDATERERDDAVKALEMARAATASDPAPASDDRERLVEALRKIANLRYSDAGEPFDEALDIADAALAAEASR